MFHYKKGCDYVLSDVLKAELEVEQNTVEIIKMDVLRTFSNDKNFPRDQLIDVLKGGTTILQQGPGYCQGMNYIAALGFRLSTDKQKIFEFYLATIQRRLFKIFDQNFDKLKSFFYVLDSLIFLYVPSVYDNFNVGSLEIWHKQFLFQLILVHYCVYSCLSVH